MSHEVNRIARLVADYTAAWNSHSPAAVAGFFAESGSIVVNAGETYTGQEGVMRLAADFFNDVPDLLLRCDGVRCSGRHVLYPWTFTGTHSATGKPLEISGWEEWDLDESDSILFSRGWFDMRDYARQAGLDQEPEEEI
ncbi:MAG: nuclear transport factor 2 family protein [Pseudomonadota bacterium]